jgi:hypothetical protein
VEERQDAGAAEEGTRLIHPRLESIVAQRWK